MVTPMATESLYQRLGGQEGITGVVNGLYDRLTSGPDSWFHWKGRTDAHRESEAQSFTHLVCAAAGGPVKSKSSEPNDVGLDIKHVQWRTFVNLAAETLDAAGLGDKKMDQFFAILAKAKEGAGGNHDRPLYPAVFAAFPRTLTDREREVLTLVAMGRNNSEIAGELFISINTVTRHVTNIFTKTSTKNRVEAAVYAAKRHFV